MKIQKSRLREIIREELAKRCLALLEAPKEKASVADAEDDNRDKDDREKDDDSKGKRGPGRPPKADPAKDQKATPPATPDAGDGDDEEEGPGHEPPSDKLGPGSGGSDKDQETAADVGTGGELSKDLEGKTVQSITMEPKSKILPGAQEITITFSQIPEPLRILVTKQGKVSFYHKGLHNKL
jgi:hypothetical protein